MFLCLSIISCSGSNSSNSQISPPTNVTISGHISYDFVPHSPFFNGLDYNNIEQKPVRAVKVQAVRDNGSTLASGITNETGNYTLMVPSNSSVRIRVAAQVLESNSTNWDVQVIDNTDGNALYVLEGALMDSGSINSERNLNAGSGWGGSAYTNIRAAAPFAILDSIYDAMQLLYSVENNLNFPPLTINWSENNRPAEGNLNQGDIKVSHYNPNTKQIFLLGKENVDTDEYDRSVIIHEWGHFFEDSFSRSDSIGGPHATGDRLDMRLAFSEGWSTAISGMVLGNPIYSDTLGEQQRSGYNYSIDDTNVVNPGWYNEDSIVAILYNLFDNVNDSTDTISLGFAPLYQIMTNQQRTTPFFTSILTFITALKVENTTNTLGINTLVNSQNIESLTMDEEGSTEKNSSNFNQILPIYTELLLDGAIVNLCMSDHFGTINKLGNNRFLKFSIPSQGTYRVQAIRSPLNNIAGDPNFFIYQNGNLTIPGNLEGDNSEVLTTSLSSGEYVMDFQEHTFYKDVSPHDNLACYDISLKTQ